MSGCRGALHSEFVRKDSHYSLHHGRANPLLKAPMAGPNGRAIQSGVTVPYPSCAKFARRD